MVFIDHHFTRERHIRHVFYAWPIFNTIGYWTKVAFKGSIVYDNLRFSFRPLRCIKDLEYIKSRSDWDRLMLDVSARQIGCILVSVDTDQCLSWKVYLSNVASGSYQRLAALHWQQSPLFVTTRPKTWIVPWSLFESLKSIYVSELLQIPCWIPARRRHSARHLGVIIVCCFDFWFVWNEHFLVYFWRAAWVPVVNFIESSWSVWNPVLIQISVNNEIIPFLETQSLSCFAEALPHLTAFGVWRLIFFVKGLGERSHWILHCRRCHADLVQLQLVFALLLISLRSVVILAVVEYRLTVRGSRHLSFPQICC